MKNMVIHCASGIKNSGDEAILDTLINLYSKQYRITVISLNAEYTSTMHSGITVLGHSERQKCRKAIDECDIFILGGGGLLQDTTTIFNIFRWLLYLKYAVSINKYTYVYANSIGPIHYTFNKIVCKKILKKVSRITVRDSESVKILQSLQISCELTADPVFNLEVTDVALSGLNVNLPQEYVVIAIRHWFDTIPFIPVSVCTKFGIRSRRNIKKYDNYISSLRACVTYINEVQKLPVVFLSFCYARDAKVAQDILNTSSLADTNVIINEEYMCPSQFISTIKGAKLLIGMRLHSLIYALKVNCPFVPILYESKVKSLIEMIQMTKLAVDVNTISAEDLIIKVGNAIENRETIISHTQKHYQVLCCQETNNYISPEEKQ